MSVSSGLKLLYSKIPSFKCKEGCSKCCSSMPLFNDEEWANVPEKKLTTNYYCPYKSDKGCEIYEHRSFICRLFGNVEGFTCPEGYGPDKLISHEDGRKLKIAYFELGA